MFVSCNNDEPSKPTGPADRTVIVYMAAENNLSTPFAKIDTTEMIAGSKKLSKHSQGLAIDINPLYNPCVRRLADGTTSVQPATAGKYVNRNRRQRFMIDRNDLCYRLFVKHGFTWGGSWRSLKDYQHFER